MINVKMQTPEVPKLSPKIAVIGVGGAGGNAVNNMISSNLDGCEFLVCNTDAQALSSSLSEDQVQLGVSITGGLGAGSKPDVGQAAAEESLEEVLRYLDGANMAFVTAGMGGGTGTGAAPVIAKACRQQGILTVGVVTKPFHFEGVHRMEQAEKGIKEMQQYVDTLIVIPNQNLFRIANEKTTFAEAFKMADTVLQSGVRGVTDLMVRPGLVNLDFADIRTAMLQMGKAMMGTGEASGDKRAIEAAEAAINNPLLDDVSMKGANGVIINVTGGFDMTLFEADEACNRIRDEVDPSANIIFGATFDESMDGLMRVSIVATGIESQADTKTGGTFSGGNTPKIERSIPNAESVAKASPIRQATTAQQEQPKAMVTGRDMIKGLTAPQPISRGNGPIIPKAAPAEPETQEYDSIDMFEQGEFSDQKPVLRGETVNNSFIPPEPVMPDMTVKETAIGSHISSYHGAHVEAKRPAASTPSSLQLNPPRRTMPHNQESRGPSLFERITGSVQQRIDNMRDDGEMVKANASEDVKSPSQGTLNIKEPSKPSAKADDELDIPAFLRRQAN